ncbi:MAG: class I SAM-dependent methyltransferase [Gammaproteobacteria bacterium]|nr:class I SAM-dependent methyltransferase [Gammaproteobacteria bacterium]
MVPIPDTDSKQSGKRKGTARGRARQQTMAAKADKHVLYQQSVQCVESEIDFVDQTFRRIRKRKAQRLREDFCGTANTASEWVRRRRNNVAVGVDLDAEVLEWGRAHNIASLGSAGKRLTLIQQDVLKVKTEPMDMVLAMNFSYWLFRDRQTMRRYFRSVHKSLVEDGIFFLDAYGGYECYKPSRERTQHKGFTYIWDQASYDPISGEMDCYIHFRFPDGSRLDKAFSYSWRFWHLTELREILAEAGFPKVDIYWQGTDEETGEGNGEFTVAEVGEPDPAWIVYIVAQK